MIRLIKRKEFPLIDLEIELAYRQRAVAAAPVSGMTRAAPRARPAAGARAQVRREDWLARLKADVAALQRKAAADGGADARRRPAGRNRRRAR